MPVGLARLDRLRQAAAERVHVPDALRARRVQASVPSASQTFTLTMLGRRSRSPAITAAACSSTTISPPRRGAGRRPHPCTGRGCSPRRRRPGRAGRRSARFRARPPCRQDDGTEEEEGPQECERARDKCRQGTASHSLRRIGSCKGERARSRPYTCAVDLDLVFLGTSAPCRRRVAASRAPWSPRGRADAPRLWRGHPAPAPASTVGLVELPEVFLTHYHADHYLGLPGMLKTFALRGREVPLGRTGRRGSRSSSGACAESSAS